MVKNPNWQEADQLAIYKRSRGVELGATKKQLLLAVRAGLEPGTSGFRPRISIHYKKTVNENKENHPLLNV